ncbi:outer membrane lipoprotein carrier protein LolA [Stutzerimonas xanthomarina]|uniref:outer membrane lipoprotein carrier protein LolA n=1 Tax=Stutzerimonas xanthomarina TaxID=271420 RepID=UPI003AA8E6D4
MRLFNGLFCRTLITLGLLLAVTARANAFDLLQLSLQLGEPAVVRGTVTQEKYLRALPQPLVSVGTFVLARDSGLLWFLQDPVQQDHRISAAGIARRTPSGWQQTRQQGPAARQNELFLAVLQGDTEALQRDFELQLTGTAQAWALTLTPRSRLLAQIFSSILIQGGATAERIELSEAQGDSTLLLLTDIQIDDQLGPSEHHDLAD